VPADAVAHSLLVAVDAGDGTRGGPQQASDTVVGDAAVGGGCGGCRLVLWPAAPGTGCSLLWLSYLHYHLSCCCSWLLLLLACKKGRKGKEECELVLKRNSKAFLKKTHLGDNFTTLYRYL